MKRHKRKQNSLVLFCALHFLVYTLLLVGVYGLFQYLVNERMNAAFFSIDDLLQYQEALEREDYGAIPAKNVSFLIFDDEGHTVYASNRTIGEKVFFEDLDMLDDYHSGKLLDVFQSQTADGSVEYTVYLSTYAEAGKAPKLLSSCVLDEDYNILRGDLFAGRQALTQREFNLLCGISKTNSMAEKYTYETTTGEGRTLVFFATRMGEREYDQSLRWANSLWLAGVPCILLVVLGCILSFPWRMKKRIHPLSQAIEAYGQGKAAEISQEDIPSEFDETVVSFRRLLDQLDQARREKERVYQEKQTLIADISHDLRTPLTVIQGYTEALEEGKVPPGQGPGDFLPRGHFGCGGAAGSAPPAGTAGGGAFSGGGHRPAVHQLHLWLHRPAQRGGGEPPVGDRLHRHLRGLFRHGPHGHPGQPGPL